MKKGIAMNMDFKFLLGEYPTLFNANPYNRNGKFLHILLETVNCKHISDKFHILNRILQKGGKHKI